MKTQDQSIVEFERTKNHYKVLSNNILLKNPETGEWQRGVLYEQYKVVGQNGEYVEVPEDEKLSFVREWSDFKKKFTLCLDL